MQIDTTQNANPSNNEAPAILKERMKEKVDQFMGQRETSKRIEKLLGKNQNRLTFTVDEVRDYDEDLANFVKKNPIEAINMFENQLDGAIKDMKDEGAKGQNSEKQMANQGDRAFPTKVQKYYVSFEGNFGKNHVIPRGLNAALVN